MKFTITEDFTFDWPVKMKVPDPKRAGAKIEQSFGARFRYMPRTEALDLQTRFLELKTQAERDAHEHDLIRKVMVGWDEKDVVDDEGEPIAFTPEALEQALEYTWFREATYAAYHKAITSEGARRGN